MTVVSAEIGHNSDEGKHLSFERCIPAIEMVAIRETIRVQVGVSQECITALGLETLRGKKINMKDNDQRAIPGKPRELIWN
jgi:hypothetical protein